MRKSITFWLVAAASMGWLLWQVEQRYRRTRGTNSAEAYIDAREEDSLCRPDRKAWNNSKKGAFVIAAIAGCPACEVAKPLEARIEDYGRVHEIPTFYVVNAGAKDEKLAIELKAAGKVVLRIEPRVFGVTKVPTFMRVDDGGNIQAMWVGAPREQHLEDEAFGLVTAGRTSRGYDVISPSELPAYVANPGYQILALSEMGLRKTKRAKVLPLRDLYIRARYELSPDLGVVVDCGSAPSAAACQEAAIILAARDFRHVVAAGLPHRSRFCF